MKNTHLAESIQEVLKEKHLLSAKELLAYFEEKGRSYNKTSVYRAIDQLLEEAILCRYDFKEAEAQYELRNDHHDHFICENCGKIETIHCQLPTEPALKKYKITHHHLTLMGLCESCQRLLETS